MSAIRNLQEKGESDAVARLAEDSHWRGSRHIFLAQLPVQLAPMHEPIRRVLGLLATVLQRTGLRITGQPVVPAAICAKRTKYETKPYRESSSLVSNKWVFAQTYVDVVPIF